MSDRPVGEDERTPSAPAESRANAGERLSDVLVCVADIAIQVRAGRSLTEALADASYPSPGFRGAVQDLSFRLQRRRAVGEALLARLASRAPSEPRTHALAIAALALLPLPVAPRESAGSLPQDDWPSDAPYPAHTLVSEAVNAMKASKSTAPAAGFLNGVLRAALRQGPELTAELARDPVTRFSYPAWWIAAVRKAYPDQWMTILSAGNQAAPLTVRVNRSRTGLQEYLALCASQGQQASPVGLQAVRLTKPVPVERIPGFVDGLVSVQDEAAQRAAPLLDLSDGLRVLDACAAPGGKTGHLAELARLDLTALDVDEARLGRVADNLRRLGLSAHLRVGDAARPEQWWDGKPFDRILADVPCTASGIVRRHPDIRWLRRSSDIAALSVRQQQILDSLWRLLVPGGKLLLVTCSIFPQECEHQASAFLARHRDAVGLPAPGQLLPIAAANEDHDGLYFALFQKTA